ncbi:YihY/virulence factor BrkB family protein [Thermoactinospora rubra]|uniref:YihY/virulence factor BrkB family protein n=1 Tax=Thermoactinospora rubra TaxID=1088767 RepID=UPI000A0FA4EC|nr:YihY/virulence factor BrkB family protein [Thermoactinospora rubra]
MTSLTERVAAMRARGRALVEAWRVRWPWLDHLIRTVQRYQLVFGDRLAGAVTYFAFLSFFPLIVLAFSVFGFVLTGNAQLEHALDTAIKEQLPGLADKLNIDAIKQARTGAGIIGLAGLLYAGLGALDALRGALRQIAMTTTPPLNFLLAKLRDLAALLLIGVTLLFSSLASGFATAASRTVADFLGLSAIPVWLVGVLVSGLADWVMFMIVLGWEGKIEQPFRVVARGALLGAIGFQALKQLATLLLSGTLNNPVYGAFAVIVGLLVWINFSARLTLYVAAWTATAGLSPPPAPTPMPSSGGTGRLGAVPEPKSEA